MKDELDVTMEDILENMEDIMENVEQYGVAIQHIYPTEDDPGPSFCYTIGLTKINRPEIITFSLPPKLGQSLLNSLAIGHNSNYQVDTLLTELASLPMTVKEIDDMEFVRNEYLCAATALYGVYQVNQLVWPDKEKNFPWDIGYDQRFNDAQPCYFKTLH